MNTELVKTAIKLLENRSAEIYTKRTFFVYI